MARKKQKWQVGDYFGIPIEDDFLAVGQILGKYDWIGVACLITKMKISSKNHLLWECQNNRLPAISVFSCHFLKFLSVIQF